MPHASSRARASSAVVRYPASRIVPGPSDKSSMPPASNKAYSASSGPPALSTTTRSPISNVQGCTGPQDIRFFDLFAQPGLYPPGHMNFSSRAWLSIVVIAAVASFSACGGSKKPPVVVEETPSEDAGTAEPLDAAPPAPKSLWEKLGGKDGV